MGDWGTTGKLEVGQNNLCQTQRVVVLRDKALEVRSEPLKDSVKHIKASELYPEISGKCLRICSRRGS